MLIKCTRTCESMSAGEVGTFKGVRASGNMEPIYIVKKFDGQTVRVPVSCCKSIKDHSEVKA